MFKWIGSYLLGDAGVRRRLGRLITHPFAFLAVATVAAAVIGVWLTDRYQSQAWAREKQFEAYRANYQGATALLDELSEAMSRRMFGLNRVVWVAKGTGTGDLDEVWEEYYESVVDWNVKLARYRSRLSRFVGTEAAEAFSSPEDAVLSYSPGTPTSIHGQFLVTHQKVRVLVDCVREDQCQEQARQTALQAAQQELNALGEAVDAFQENCTNQLYQSS